MPIPTSPAQINFVTGQFHRFRNLKEGLHLGKIQRTMNVGVVVEFDGLVLRLGVEDHVMPEFRSALNMGWFELTDETFVREGLAGRNGPPAVSPTINAPAVAASRTAQQMSGGFRGGVVQGEQREVGRATRSATPAAAGPAKFNPTLVREDRGDGLEVGPATRAGRAAAAAGQPPASALLGREVGSVVELNGDSGVVVAAGFRTSVSTALRVDGSSANAVVDAARAPGVTAASGNVEGTVVGRVGVPARAAPAAPAATAPKAPATAPKAPAAPAKGAPKTAAAAKAAPPAAKAASPAAKAPAETPAQRAERIRLERKEAAEKAAEKAAAPEVKVAALPETSAPEVTITPGTATPSEGLGDGPLQLAPGLLWDKTLHWASRVKKALAYRDRPELLDLILAAESPGVVKEIRKALAVPAPAAAPASAPL